MRNLSLLYCTVLLLTFSLVSNAQISITASSPFPPVSINQLWNINVSGPADGKQYCAEMQVEERGQGLILQQRTIYFSFLGNAVINDATLTDFSPISLVYSMPTLQKDIINNGGFMPNGNYLVTFRLFNKVAGSAIGEEVAKASYNLAINNSYLLLLTSPYNKQILLDPLPVFTWFYSGKMSTECGYEFVTKEIQKGQSAADAMLYNQVYSQKLVSEPVYAYSIEDRPLIEGHNYAWMVKVRCGKDYIAASEIWSFSIKNNDKKEELEFDPNAFYKVKTNEDGGEALIDDNMLKVRYINEFVDNDGFLKYSIINDKNKVVITEKEYMLRVTTGDNRYLLKLCPESGLYLKPGRYKFIITDDKGQMFYMKFNNKPKTGC